MKLAVMQPYLFPYLGYFQLIHAVDSFVVYDDVNFIKGGWINRNFILTQGQKHLLSLQLNGASPNALINQVTVGNNKKKLLKTIKQNYAKAPQFDVVFPLIEDVLLCEEKNLAVYLGSGLRKICDYLNLSVQWFLSSELDKDNSLRGQDKVMAICKELGATHYINAQGGKELYDVASFSNEQIELSFVEPKAVKYKQFNHDFESCLSIIDVMMFNDEAQFSELLREYSLV